MKEFIHLHTHTEYSLLDGANKVDKLIAEVSKQGQTAIAITDHGNMFGALDFYNTALSYNIKPIIGCEVYIAKGSRLSKHSKINTYNHLTLLARNDVGYRNLLKLTSLSFIEGLSNRPRIDLEILQRYNEGINCLSGCLSGRINRLFLQDREEEAKDYALDLRDLFGKDHFWLELQRNGLNIQDKVNIHLIQLSKDTGIPLVGTNDIHYLRGEDCEFQDTILCINTGARKEDPDRFRMDTNTLYLKSSSEMVHMFRDLPVCITATNDVVDQIDLTIDQGTYRFPKFSTGTVSSEQELDSLCQKGLIKRYGSITNEIKERYKKEFETICQMGFPEYFLIVKDFIDYANNRGIPVGPGRGSAAGCIVSYALGITDVDPIKYNLLFERFLNSSRIGIPDIDVDFCQQRRKEVIDYLKTKYGDDRVASVMTFGTFGPKASIRQIARVHSVPLKESDQIAKKCVADSIAESLENDKTLSKDKAKYPEVFKSAEKIEGMVSYAGTHASGIVISDKPLYEVVPIARHKDGTIVTQWDLDDCEKVGLVKFDLLGLETLTVIERIQLLIKQRHGQRIDLKSLDLDDKNIYKILCKGDTEGVFQCYSDGMQRLLIDMQPDNFEDIIAAIALFRPGPLESGIAKQYIDRKHGREPVVYLHDDVKRHLSNTYGCMIYQEQIMQLAQALAGFSLNEADELRKAVGKKKMDMLRSIKQKWLNGCKNEKKISKTEGISLWNDILKFGRYGFNRSHSASYAFLTYHTAYLKYNYPVEFFAANLTQVMGRDDKMRAFITDAKAHNIELLPPQLGVSKWDFEVKSKDSIVLGLGMIKGLGKAIAPHLQNIDVGNYSNIMELLVNLPKEPTKQSVLKPLTSSGALDYFNIDRGQLYAAIPSIAKKLQAYRRKIDQGKEAKIPEINFDSFEKWDINELLKAEKNTLSFFLSGHPLQGKSSLAISMGAMPIRNALELKQEANVALLGVVTNVTVKGVKSGKNAGKKYARVLIEDEYAEIVCMVFTHLYNKVIEKIKYAEDISEPVLMIGRVSTENKEPQLVVKQMYPLSKAPNRNETIRIPVTSNTDFSTLSTLINSNEGDKLVVLEMTQRDSKPIIIRTNKLVNPTEIFLSNLQDIIYGKDS